MSFSSTLTLDDAGGDAVVYKLIATDRSGTDRVNVATTSSEPSKLLIRHTANGSGANALDRHLVSFEIFKANASGILRKLTVNLTIAVPRDPIITSQDVFDTVSNCIDFVSDGGFTDSGIAGTTTLAGLLLGES